MSDETIKRYTVHEIRAKRARGESQTDWARIDAMTEAEIEAATAGDEDTTEIEWDWESAELVTLPEATLPPSTREMPTA